jgi:hypothetical protein
MDGGRGVDAHMFGVGRDTGRYEMINVYMFGVHGRTQIKHDEDMQMDGQTEKAIAMIVHILDSQTLSLACVQDNSSFLPVCLRSSFSPSHLPLAPLFLPAHLVKCFNFPS